MLLSTFNGERYLEMLLESLYRQRGAAAEIFVRDDGSSDGTLDILRREEEEGRLRWYGGKNLGPARSFLALLRSAPEREWYAFCDQDDVWLEDKLVRALESLRSADRTKGALYYGRPRLTDAQLRPLPPTKRALERMTTFSSSLVASNATGCTMVFNYALRRIVDQTTPGYVYMHDDWVHKLCLLSGGRLFFDEDVPLLYRQHWDNYIGMPGSDLEKLRRWFRRMRERECTRSRTVCSLLNCCARNMGAEDRQIAEKVRDYKNSFPDRLRLAFDGRVRSGYPARDLLFLLAVLCKAY